MRRQPTLITFVLLMLSSTTAVVPQVNPSVRGTVSERYRGCANFVVETRRGYDVLEWRQGYEPDEDDVIVGKSESYGFHDVLDETRGRGLRAFTLHYWLGTREASEKLRQSCR